MGNIKPRDYVIGVTVFTILIVAVISMIDLGYEQTPEFVEDDKYTDFQETFDKRQALQANITAMQLRLQEQQEPSLLTQINILYNKGYAILSSLFSSLDFAEDIITGTTKIFGFIIPNWLPALLITLVTIMIIFSIVSALFNRDL